MQEGQKMISRCSFNADSLKKKYKSETVTDNNNNKISFTARNQAGSLHANKF